MNWRDHITINPAICHGRARISGTRVLVTTVLGNLADGRDADDIARIYPSVSREAVLAVLCYVAVLANERVVALRQLGQPTCVASDVNHCCSHRDTSAISRFVINPPALADVKWPKRAATPPRTPRGRIL